MNKKPCKECPWVIKNNHNNTIVNFSKKTNKPHNCHMTEGGGTNLWDVKEKTKCQGRKEYEKLFV
jgi:hypothetical protein